MSAPPRYSAVPTAHAPAGNCCRKSLAIGSNWFGSSGGAQLHLLVGHLLVGLLIKWNLGCAACTESRGEDAGTWNYRLYGVLSEIRPRVRARALLKMTGSVTGRRSVHDASRPLLQQFMLAKQNYCCLRREHSQASVHDAWASSIAKACACTGQA